jgi:hypothetical protein
MQRGALARIKKEIMSIVSTPDIDSAEKHP